MRYKHLIRPLNVVFDQPYPTQWTQYSDGYEVYFEAANGDIVMIQFEEWPADGLWLVAFKRGVNWLQTNTGDQFRIFSTVIQSIKEFVQKVNPKYIAFSSNKGESSRSRLYKKMVNKLISSAGFINMTGRIDVIPDTITRNWLRNKARLHQDYDIFVLMRSEMANKEPELDRRDSYIGPYTLRVGNLRAQESAVTESHTDVIDNYKGAGAVPNNQDVDYFGMRVRVRPSMFLKLALPLDRDDERIERLKEYLQNGGKIGSPFFEIALPDSWLEGNFEGLPKIKSHEGRHRMIAIMELWGDDPVETHLFFRGGLRARNLTPDIQRALNEEIISERGHAVMGPWFR